MTVDTQTLDALPAAALVAWAAEAGIELDYDPGRRDPGDLLIHGAADQVDEVLYLLSRADDLRDALGEVEA